MEGGKNRKNMLLCKQMVRFSLFVKLLVLAGFLGLAVFGFASMSHADGHNPACIFAALKVADCSGTAGFIKMFVRHLNAFKNFAAFSGGTILSQIWLSLFVSFSLAAGFGVFGFAPKIFFPPFHNFLVFVPASKSKYRLTTWLSLHENSPAVF